MKALSFSRPWDYAVLYCGKDVENRKWQTHFRGRICVHRAKSWDEDGFKWMCQHREDLGISYESLQLMRDSRIWAQSGLVGEVDITDCVLGPPDESDSPWYFGPYGFTLANPKAYEKIIPCRGALKLWTVPTTNGQIARQVRDE